MSEGIEDSIRAIERAAGALATASVARMDDVLPWFRGLPADQRSWVMLVAQAGVRSFVEWLRGAGSAAAGTSSPTRSSTPRRGPWPGRSACSTRCS